MLSSAAVAASRRCFKTRAHSSLIQQHLVRPATTGIVTNTSAAAESSFQSNNNHHPTQSNNRNYNYSQRQNYHGVISDDQKLWLQRSLNAKNAKDAASTLEPYWFVEHPGAPQSLGWIDNDIDEKLAASEVTVDSDQDVEYDDDDNTDKDDTSSYQMLNRNRRRGKRANKGKRPCSRHRRRTKSRAIGRHRR